MAGVLHDPETGENFLETADGSLVPITPEQAQEGGVAGEGGFGATINSLGNSLAQTGTGALAVLGVEGMKDRNTALRETQAVRQEANPGGALGGEIAGFAPDVAAIALTGGSAAIPTIGRRLAVDAAIEGTLSVARDAGDNPVQAGLTGAALGVAGGVAAPLVTRAGRAVVAGAQKGKAVAENIIGTVRPRRPGQVLDGINAQRNVRPSAEGGELQLRGMLSPEELGELSDDFGAPKLTTKGDDLALRADNPDALAAADDRRGQEELFRSSPVSNAIAGDVGKTRDAAKSVSTNVVMRELGEPNASRLTSANMNRLGKDIGGKFDEVAEEAGDLSFGGGDIAKLDDTLTKATADDERLVQKYIDDMTADMGEQGVLNHKTAAQYRTRLGKDITNAANSGQMARAQSLGEIQDVLDDIVERQIPDDVAETLSEARYQYRIYKSLQRSTSTTNAGGELNTRSFLNSYQRRGNRSGRSSGRTEKGEKFFRTMETLNYLEAKVAPNSGTADRLLAGALGPNLGPAAAAAGGTLGAGALLSGGQ